MPLFFCLFFIFYYKHTFIQSHSYNSFIRRHSLRPLAISSSLVCSVGKPPCGAEPRIELGPALQQADKLPSEPRRTINGSRRTIFCTYSVLCYITNSQTHNLFFLLCFSIHFLKSFLFLSRLYPSPSLR
jgi:hypothetical protein